MYHIVTVHWRTADWIDAQLDYLRRNLAREHRVYAFLNGVDPEPHQNKFAFVSTQAIKQHALKLNLLAEIVCMNGADDDVLIFLDSDAFPVADLTRLQDQLTRYPLIAVRRDENLGDPQPHPCFCMTTVGLWRKLRGDWQPGYQWRNSKGAMITGVGGNLMQQLTEARIDWLPLLRSNTVDEHPLFFAVYGDLIYHHGAGSRRMVGGRVGRARFNAAMPRFARLLLRATGIQRRRLKRLAADNLRLSEQIYDQLRADPDFYRRFVPAETTNAYRGSRSAKLGMSFRSGATAEARKVDADG